MLKGEWVWTHGSNSRYLGTAMGVGVHRHWSHKCYEWRQAPVWSLPVAAFSNTLYQSHLWWERLWGQRGACSWESTWEAEAGERAASMMMAIRLHSFSERQQLFTLSITHNNVSSEQMDRYHSPSQSCAHFLEISLHIFLWEQRAGHPRHALQSKSKPINQQT